MRLTTLTLLLTLGLATTSEAQAQVRFLPYVGYNLNAGYDIDAEAAITEDIDRLDTRGGFLIGVGAEFAVTPGLLPVVLKVRPSVETIFLPGDEASFTISNGSETGEAILDFSQTAFQFSGDLIAEFAMPTAPIVPYAGLGLTYITYTLELDLSGDLFLESDEIESFEDFGGADGSAIGANVLGGIRFGSGFVAPFVQARYSLADPSPDEAQDADNEIGNGFSILAGVSIGL